MTAESPKSPQRRPPTWPTRTPAEAGRVPPLAADPAPWSIWYDPAPPWWHHWWYDPAPPWWDKLEARRKGTLVQAEFAYRRRELENKIDYLGALIEVLGQDQR